MMPITIHHRLDCLERNEQSIWETVDKHRDQFSEIDRTLKKSVELLELHASGIMQHDNKLKQVHEHMRIIVNMHKETMDYLEETNSRIDRLDKQCRDIDLYRDQIIDIQTRLSKLEGAA